MFVVLQHRLKQPHLRGHLMHPFYKQHLTFYVMTLLTHQHLLRSSHNSIQGKQFFYEYSHSCQWNEVRSQFCHLKFLEIG